MSTGFVRVSDMETLQELLAASGQRPILVFKHSNSCGISSRAYRELENLENVNLVEVQTAREVSRELAAITGVEHETPQVIVLRNGKAVWNASHYEVKAGAVAEAMLANS
jgi:monothiol bacilliredoxin